VHEAVSKRDARASKPTVMDLCTAETGLKAVRRALSGEPSGGGVAERGAQRHQPRLCFGSETTSFCRFMRAKDLPWGNEAEWRNRAKGKTTEVRLGVSE